MTRPGAATIFLATALLACRPDGRPDIDPYTSSWLGLYAIESWTYNRDDCSAEGPSILESRSERAALVQACTIEEPKLNVRLCEDEAGCRWAACDGQIFSVDPPGWPFLTGNDHDGWSGPSWTFPREVDGHCEAVYREISVTSEDGALVIRAEYWETGDYGPPKDANEGRCIIDDDARAAVAGDPCGSFEVVRIRRLHPDCDPLAVDACAEGERCTPYGNRFLCLPAAEPFAQVGEDCDGRDCAPGLVCMPAEALTSCASPGCCTEFCDTTATDRDGQCSQQDEGLLCADFYNEGSAQPGREAVGACLYIHRCDGTQIPGEWLCDGTDDCDDGTDESEC